MKRRFLHVLTREGFPVSSLILFNSRHSTKQGCGFGKGSCRIGLLRRGSSFGSISVTFASTNNNASRRFTRAVAGCNTIVVSGSDTFHVYSSIPLIIPRIGTRSTLGHPHGVVTGPGYAAVVVMMILGPVSSLDRVGGVRVSSCRDTSNTNTTTVTRLRRRCGSVVRANGARRVGGFPRRLTCGIVPRVSGVAPGSCAGRRVGVCGRAHGVVRSSIHADTAYIHISSLHSRSRDM